MNETPFEKSQNSDDELQAEYRFDYQKAKPNRFASRSGTQQLTVVVLDEDVLHRKPSYFDNPTLSVRNYYHDFT